MALLPEVGMLARPRSGADVVIEAFLAEGVDTVFGYPGGAILPFYDALYGATLQHILVRHEQAAAHAADGYARASGRVGVCVATSGPGATNLITGLASAYMDSIPVVAVTGQVGRGFIGRDSFQESDVFGMTLPVTKHNYLVQDPEALPAIMREAFFLARSGRPGPVLVDIPKDVLQARVRAPLPAAAGPLRGYRPVRPPAPEAVAEAARLLAAARKPLILVGGGAVRAGAGLVALAERLGSPIASTLMGLGVVPGDHPLHLGLVGMHGAGRANRAIQQCDVMLAVGLRFDDRVTGDLNGFAPRAQIIHVEIDPAEVGKNVRPRVALCTEAEQAVDALRMAPDIASQPAGRGLTWWPEVPDADKDLPLFGAELPLPETSDGMPGPWVMRSLYRHTRGEAIIVTDVGQHQMWAAQHYAYRWPRQLITSGGLGAMGFGLPAALGAQLGARERPVWAVVGDGGFQMTLQELATAVDHHLPVRVVLFRNGYLGMVRQWQHLFYDERYAGVAISNPDYEKLADAYGLAYVRCNRPAQLQETWRQADAVRGPVLVDLAIRPAENVYPMVPAGASLDDMIMEGV